MAQERNKTVKKILPVLVRDTREHEGNGYYFKASANFAGTIKKKLNFGDYTLQIGHICLEDFIIIERKQSVDELAHCLSSDRERFYKELDAMSHVPHRYILVEDYWSAVGWRTRVGRFSRMHPNAFMSTIFSLMMRHGIHIIFAGTTKNAKRIAFWILQKAYKYYMEEQCQKT
jgi:ERCC4-type nuclease